VKADNRDEKAVASTEVVTAQGTFYVVQSGDTLSGIADDYDSSVEELRKMNKLGRRAVLRVGLKLKVPPKDEGLPSDPSGVARRESDEQRGNKSSNARNDRVAGERSPQGVSPAAGVASRAVTHVVRRGENLTLIAKKYGVSVQQIRVANNINRKSVLKVGSELVIPMGTQGKVNGEKAQPKQKRVHVVRRGENLSHIADRYRVSVGHLLKHNDLKRASKLFVGVRLLIPESQASR
jgi:membrane-bound lytic murein transglycosylase D